MNMYYRHDPMESLKLHFLFLFISVKRWLEEDIRRCGKQCALNSIKRAMQAVQNNEIHRNSKIKDKKRVV